MSHTHLDVRKLWKIRNQNNLGSSAKSMCVQYLLLRRSPPIFYERSSQSIFCLSSLLIYLLCHLTLWRNNNNIFIAVLCFVFLDDRLPQCQRPQQSPCRYRWTRSTYFLQGLRWQHVQEERWWKHSRWGWKGPSKNYQRSRYSFHGQHWTSRIRRLVNLEILGYTVHFLNSPIVPMKESLFTFFWLLWFMYDRLSVLHQCQPQLLLGLVR